MKDGLIDTTQNNNLKWKYRVFLYVELELKGQKTGGASMTQG